MDNLFLKQVESVLKDETDCIANMANLSALLYIHLDNVNWLGFYINRNNELVLGPFQGNVACVRIPWGKGVCGTAAEKKTTIIVDDVHKFPGHIACDSASNSEIVIPVIKNGAVKAVLDIDSPKFSRFTQNDKEYLEQIIEIFILNTKLTDL